MSLELLLSGVLTSLVHGSLADKSLNVVQFLAKFTTSFDQFAVFFGLLLGLLPPILRGLDDELLLQISRDLDVGAFLEVDVVPHGLEQMFSLFLPEQRSLLLLHGRDGVHRNILGDLESVSGDESLVESTAVDRKSPVVAADFLPSLGMMDQ